MKQPITLSPGTVTMGHADFVPNAKPDTVMGSAFNPTPIKTHNRVMTRAVVLTELGKPLVLANLETPNIGVGQVRVKVEYAAICGAQLNEIDGAKGPDKYLPHLLGHEGVGQVMEIGPGVTTKAVGDWVILHWRPSEGIAAKGPVYAWERHEPLPDGAVLEYHDPVNAGPMACFADECIVAENRLTLLPDGIDHRVAPLFGCALTTAYGVVTRDADVKPGQSVLVFGAGGVGFPILQMASLVGADISAVEPDAEKCLRACEWADASNRAPDGPFDVVIDTTGLSSVIEQAYALTKPQGRCILVGVPKHDDPITIHSLPLHFGKVLKGSHGGESKPHEDIPLLARLVKSEQLLIDDIVTDEFQLEEVNEAIALVRSGEAGRVLLRMQA